jgi:hypothetical protein
MSESDDIKAILMKQLEQSQARAAKAAASPDQPVFVEYEAVFLEWLRQAHVPGFYLTPDASPTAASRSRMGGLPSLPADLEWPVHLRTRQPLHFIAQIDLGTLPPLGARRDGKPTKSPLPASGLLFFFADMGGDFAGGDTTGAAPGIRVLYAAAAGPEHAMPDGLPMIGHAAGQLTGEYASDAATFEPMPLQPYAVDTFHLPTDFYIYEPEDFGVDFDADDGGVQATAQALAAWTGGNAKTFVPLLECIDMAEFWDHLLAVQTEPLRDEAGKERGRSLERIIDQRRLAPGFDMLGADGGSFDDSYKAEQNGHVLLLRFCGFALRPIYFEDGSFEFYIKPDDLAAGHFDRAWAMANGS